MPESGLHPEARPGGPPTTNAATPQAAAAPQTSKKQVIASGVGVVLVIAGLVGYFTWPRHPSTLTFENRPIADASGVLSKAERAVDALVAAKHGVKTDETRCYYVQPRKPAPGASPSNIESGLRCGPVLFAGGHRRDEYLSVPFYAAISSLPGSQATLTPQTAGLGTTLTANAKDIKLVRPDRLKPPTGDGGLALP